MLKSLLLFTIRRRHVYKEHIEHIEFTFFQRVRLFVKLHRTFFDLYEFKNQFHSVIEKDSGKFVFLLSTSE